MRFDWKAAAIVAVGMAAGSWGVVPADAETFEDDCSVSVIIKRPYADDKQLESSDIILAKQYQGNNVCPLVNGNPPTHEGVCQTSAGQDSAWTRWFDYREVRNPETRRFRWVCGNTLERSRCVSGTRKVRFKLLKNSDEFRTQCSPSPL
jgi:hypothetical protein